MIEETRGHLRIAVLERDLDQRNRIVGWLDRAGHRNRTFAHGRDLIRTAATTCFDLFVVDSDLSDMGSEEVIAEIRQQSAVHPLVLVTSVRDREEDVAAALRAGADDYLVKPLREAVFLARIESAWRRFRKVAVGDDVFSVGQYRINLTQHMITRDGHPVVLTQKEISLAAYLLRNVGRLLSRNNIQEMIWGTRGELNSRTIDAHVAKLRKRLWFVPENGWRLVSIYRQGYRLEQIQSEPTSDEFAIPAMP